MSLTGKDAALGLSAGQETQLLRVNDNGELVVAQSSATPAPVLRDQALTEVRADAILTSAFVAATTFALAVNVRSVTVVLVYTRNAGSTTGYPTLKFQYASTTPALTIDGTVQSGASLQTPETYDIGPSGTFTVEIPIVNLPAGCTGLIVSVKETGDTTNLGNARLLCAQEVQP